MNEEKIIDEIANLTHEEFKKMYLRDNNGSRIKATTDDKWINENSIDEIDLAKIDYVNLPNDWKNRRRNAAKTAFYFLLEGVANNTYLDDEFVEKGAHLVYDDWLARNKHITPESHETPYSSLSEKDKEKNRIFVKTAIKIYKKRDTQ
jgi:hypothetical protein